MRDDFTQATKDSLSKRVGGLCSNPSCQRPTHGPRNDDRLAVSIGVAAHISAASLGGPRYDPSLSPEARSDINNGIWLCQNCAKLIDNDPVRFGVQILLSWRDEAESRALKAILGADSEPLRNTTAVIPHLPMSNQDSPAKAYLEFRRLETLGTRRERVEPIFAEAMTEIDEAGGRAGWDVVELPTTRLDDLPKILDRFRDSTEAVRISRKLDHHYLSVVVYGGTTAENEATALEVRRLCEGSSNQRGIRVLIGYMAGIRYVDLVLTGA